VHLVCAATIAGCSSSGVGATPTIASPPVRASVVPAALSCQAPISTLPDANGVHGLYVWIHNFLPATELAAIRKYVIPDSTVCGASIVVLWSQVDRGPGVSPQFDFTSLNEAIYPWAKAGKPVNLLFAGASETGANDTATPTWVLAQAGSNAVPLISCPDPGAGQKVSAPAPVYWLPGYATPYRKLIRRVIAKFGNDPRIGYIRFGIGMGAEDYVQHGADGACAPNWAPYGLSATFWGAYSSRLVTFVASLHPAHQIMIALNNFAGDGAPGSKTAVPNVVAATAAAAGIGFGTLNLGAFGGAHVNQSCTLDTPFPPYWCNAFDSHAGAVPLMFQTITFSFNPEQPSVAPLGQLLGYAKTNHAQAFELYPDEWLGADDPSWPTYAAHHAYLAATLKAAALWTGGAP
jgi:hypothetical protein